MGSLPLDIFPLLEEEFEMSDGDLFLDFDWCDDDSIPHLTEDETCDADATSRRDQADCLTLDEETCATSGMADTSAPLQFGADYPSSCSLLQDEVAQPSPRGQGSKRKHEDTDLCIDVAPEHDSSQGRLDDGADSSDPINDSLEATRLEDYYGPMKDSLACLRHELGGDPPDDLEGLLHLATCLDDARKKLNAAIRVRPTFGPIAAGEILDLLQMQ